MNQILNTDKRREKTKKIFIIQFRISIIFIIFGIIYIIRNIKLKEKENNISNIISLNGKLNSVFNSNYFNENNEIYIGKITSEKIGLDYYVYNNYSDENLKILPCKFYGGSLGEKGNICIIGHNYFDNRFFSNIDKLEINDILTIKDLTGNIYDYSVYKKYEIDEKDTQKVIVSEVEEEITLCTCTFDKSKRFVVRAKRV